MNNLRLLKTATFASPYRFTTISVSHSHNKNLNTTIATSLQQSQHIPNKTKLAPQQRLTVEDNIGPKCSIISLNTLFNHSCN